MAGKTTTAAPKTVTIPLDDAKRMYDAYESITFADDHFKACQSLIFRNHVHDTFNAKNVKDTYDRLKTAIDG